MAMKYLDFVFCILAVLTKSGLAVTPPPAAGPTTAGVTSGTTAFPGPPLTYTCSQGDVNEIKLTLTVEDGEFTRQMVASDISEVDGEYDDCKSTFSPDSGIHTLVIVFDVDGVQKSPLRSQKNCYVQPADVNGDIFVQVVLQRNPPYVVLGDVPRIVKCNANNLSPTSVEVVDNGVDVFTSNIYNRQKEVAKTTLGDITASLINLDSVTPGLYFVGDTVQVVIEYNYALSQPAPRPIALFVRNLVVYGSEEGFNDRITYVTQNGCKGNGVQQSFQVTSYDDVNSITISQSAPFKLKLFKKSRKAIIKLDFDAMCYTQGSPCQDQQDYCNLNGLSRKRRHVNSDSPLNGTLRLEVPILMPPSTVEDLQNQVSGSDALECSVISTNWILSIVLGSLLLIVIAMCIFLTLRLRSVMDKNVRIVDKMEGTKNEAFY